MHYQPKCQHYRKATQLCITRGCEIKNCFSCPQCKRGHPRTCEFMEYKKFVYQLHRRQGLRKQQFCRYQQKIQNTFNTLIKALKNQFIQFRQQFQRFNATQQIIRFYDAIQGSKQRQITGQMTCELLDLQIPRMQEYRIRDQIEMKRIQNNILVAHSYVIQKLKPYYALRQKFQQIQVDVPDINELKMIQDKYVDKGNIMKKGLLKGDIKYFQSLLREKIYNIQMIYRASQNNFSAAKFHQRCDGKGNTLVMAKTQFNKTIGLWCPFIWSSPEKWIYLQDINGSFMFSMQKQLKGLRFQSVKSQFSIGMHKDYGPAFGDDFVIYDKAHTSTGCWSNFPDVYNYKQKPLQHTQQVIEAFVGVKDHFQKFNLVQWEVYKISFNRQQNLDASWMDIYKKI